MTKAEITKQKLLETAAEMVVTKGYHSTTTKEIANVTGVSEGTLFKHFKSKDNLLKEIIMTIVIPFREEAKEKLIPILLKDETGSAVQKLKYLYEDRSAFLRKQGVFVQVLLQEVAINPLAKTLFHEEIYPVIDETVTALMIQGVACGAIKPYPIQLLVAGFVNQLLLPFLTKSLYNPERSESGDERVLFEIFLAGIIT